MEIQSGTVEDIDPFSVRVEQKKLLTEKQLLYIGSSLPVYEIGTKLTLLREQGGQRYLILDTISRDSGGGFEGDTIDGNIYTILLRRFLKANLDGITLEAGEPLFTTDDGKLYIGDGTGNVLVNPDIIAAALTGGAGTQADVTVEHIGTVIKLTFTIPAGKDGTAGADGTNGFSPTVNVKTNTPTEYVLTITDINSVINTPNLKGQNGTDGTDGTDGKSAFQSAVDGGFVGTEADFNANLSQVGILNEAIQSKQDATITLTDGTASNTLPPVTTPTLLNTIIQTIRNGLKWLFARFDSSGNANSANKLTNSHTFNVSGDVTGTAQSFDGQQNVTIPTTLANVATAGTTGEAANKNLTYGGAFLVLQQTIDAKGRTTAVTSRTMTMPAMPTKSDVGLGNVDNTSDANKPVSNAVIAALALKEDKANKGVPNGYAGLDANSKIFVSNIPDYLLGQILYAGTVNAATAVATLTTNAQNKLGTTSATITLTNNNAAITGYTANQGNFYLVSTAGTFAGISFDVGDWLISTATAWNKIDNTDAVTGVKGNAESTYRIGNVNITPAHIGLGNLTNDLQVKASDVQVSEPTTASLDTQVTSAKRLWAMMGGALSSLSTTAKTIVGAINELYTKASSAYQKPSTGIPKSDLDASVQTSLSKADTALQSVPDATATVKGIALLGAANGAARYGQKADVGLGNVDNTSDLNKPISTATQAALNSKQDINITLADNAGNTTLPVTTSGTITSKIQALRDNVKALFSYFTNGVANIAAKLQTAYKLKVNLASSADATFDGSSDQLNIGVTGILPVANGGTGNSTGTVNVPDATATVKGIATLGAAGGAARYGQFNDVAAVGRDFTLSNVRTLKDVARFAQVAANVTGSIKITFPYGWSATYNIMYNIRIIGFHWLNSYTAFELMIGGYTYSTNITPQWYNVSAQCTAQNIPNDMVRFGFDGTNCCIIIGDTNSVWQYPALSIVEMQMHYGQYASPALTGYTMSLVTDLTGYTFTGGTLYANTRQMLMNTTSFLNGNNGINALIRGLASAAFQTIASMPTANGVFTLSKYNAGGFLLTYTSNATIAAGTNTVDKQVVLLNEAGNSSFPGTVTLGGDPTANLQAATKQYVDQEINTRKRIYTWDSGNTTGDFEQILALTGSPGVYNVNVRGSGNTAEGIWDYELTIGWSGVNPGNINLSKYSRGYNVGIRDNAGLQVSWVTGSQFLIKLLWSNVSTGTNRIYVTITPQNYINSITMLPTTTATNPWVDVLTLFRLNASSADKLATPQALSLSGDVTGTPQNFDGQAPVTIPAALAAVTQADTTSTQSVGFGGQFVVVDDVKTDTKGRVTGKNKKTVTLPAAPVTPFATSAEVQASTVADKAIAPNNFRYGSAGAIIQTDTRSVNSPPSYYYTLRTTTLAAVVTEFKTASVIGLQVGAFCTLETIIRWSDVSGGPITQVAYTDGGVYTRNSVDVNTWAQWTSYFNIFNNSSNPNGPEPSRTLRNVAAYSEGGTPAGTIKISLPVGWTSTMMSIKIIGYNYDGTGAWELLIGGYNYGASPWYNVSAAMTAQAPPFRLVRFGADASVCCILLGSMSTVWAYPKISVETVLSASAGWDLPHTGWKVERLTSEASIIVTNSITASWAIPDSWVGVPGGVAPLDSAGRLVAGGPAEINVWQTRNSIASTTDITAGVTGLQTGWVYYVYE